MRDQSATNHRNLPVRGYKEEGTLTTPFEMTVLNELDRFHLVMDTIDRLPQTGSCGAYLKQQLEDKLIEHRRYVEIHGEDMPETLGGAVGCQLFRETAADHPSGQRPVRGEISPVCCQHFGTWGQFRQAHDARIREARVEIGVLLEPAQ